MEYKIKNVIDDSGKFLVVEVGNIYPDGTYDCTSGEYGFGHMRMPLYDMNEVEVKPLDVLAIKEKTETDAMIAKLKSAGMLAGLDTLMDTMRKTETFSAVIAEVDAKLQPIPVEKPIEEPIIIPKRK